MNSLERKRMYEDYKEMKLTYKGIVDANVKLVDEKKDLMEHVDNLQNKIDEAINYIEEKGRLKYVPEDLIKILKYTKKEIVKYEFEEDGENLDEYLFDFLISNKK